LVTRDGDLPLYEGAAINAILFSYPADQMAVIPLVRDGQE